jgi:nicotinamidase-related amidase
MAQDPYTSPHWDRCALLTIDTQRDTLDGGCFEVPGTSAILPAMRRALGAARAADRPIVHVVRLYLPDGSNVDIARRLRVEAGWHPVAPGTAGSELAVELLPEPGLRLDPESLLAGAVQRLGPHEVVLYKPRWGAFHRTSLDEHLRALGVDTLVFGGCNYPNCPRTSIYEASERDYRVVLLTDGVSRLDERGQEEMAAIGVTLCTVAEFAGAVAGVSRRSPAR